MLFSRAVQYQSKLFFHMHYATCYRFTMDIFFRSINNFLPKSNTQCSIEQNEEKQKKKIHVFIGVGAVCGLLSFGF